MRCDMIRKELKQTATQYQGCPKEMYKTTAIHIQHGTARILILWNFWSEQSLKFLGKILGSRLPLRISNQKTCQLVSFSMKRLYLKSHITQDLHGGITNKAWEKEMIREPLHNQEIKVSIYFYSREGGGVLTGREEKPTYIY